MKTCTAARNGNLRSTNTAATCNRQIARKKALCMALLTDITAIADATATIAKI